MKYDAFISYRHMPLDMEIAKKVHKGLETFPVPKAVQISSGKKKITRVFRDEEELPIGSNLTEEITAALKESEYLIVVCSPDTPGSIWVQREIETFISMHDRDHVLAILIAGEPADSFPAILTHDEEGNDVEPLAADVRGADEKERNKKFKTEIIRLAAPILSCSYDDLRQRHRERFIRRLVIEIAALAGAVAAAGILFGIYNAKVAANMEMLANDKAALAEQMRVLADEKTKLADDIYKEYQDKLVNQSRLYASKSTALMDYGDRRAAALVAAAGLPSDGKDRPYVPEAEQALGNALRAYDNGIRMNVSMALHHEKLIRDFKISSDGSRLLVRDSGNGVHVWSTDTWRKELQVSRSVRDDGYILSTLGYDADKDSVYIANDETICRYDNEGKIVWEKDTDDTVKEAVFCPEQNKGFIIYNDFVQMIDLSGGYVLKNFDNSYRKNFTARPAFDKDNKVLVCQHVDTDLFSDPVPATLSIIHYDEERVVDIEVKGVNLFRTCITPGGNVAVVSCQNDYLFAGEPGDIYLELFDTEGNLLWSKVVDVEIQNKYEFVTRLIPRGCGNRPDLIKNSMLFSIENHVLNFDEETGELIGRTELTYDVKSLMYDESNLNTWAAYDNGDIVYFDPDTGEVNSSAIRTGKDISDAIYYNNSLIFRVMYSTDIYALGYMNCVDHEDLKPIANSFEWLGMCETGKYYTMGDTNENIYCFYDYDGGLIYSEENVEGFVNDAEICEDKFILVTKDSVYYIDPNAGTTDKVDIKSIFGVKYYISECKISENGAYATFVEDKTIYVVDLMGQKLLNTYDTGDKIGSAVVSNDGKTLFVSTLNDDMYFVDVATLERTDHKGEHLRQVSNIFQHNYLVVSPDGRFVAMGCMDDVVRIMDVAANKVFAEVPIPSTDRIFLEFTEDSERLIMQGDDLKVKVWGLREGEFLGYFDATNVLKIIYQSPENSETAVFDRDGMYLLENDSYRCKAIVPFCIAYIPENRSFIQYRRGKVSRCYYKDVNALLTELERQFPGESLSQEEKDRYNIN